VRAGISTFKIQHLSNFQNHFKMVERIGIIGAGITGLASAWVLSSKYHVTIVARDMPGDLGLDWASPWYVCPEIAKFPQDTH
jgi:hypothetical protein